MSLSGRSIDAARHDIRLGALAALGEAFIKNKLIKPDLFSCSISLCCGGNAIRIQMQAVLQLTDRSVL